jgi:hypothetical protein
MVADFRRRMPPWQAMTYAGIYLAIGIGPGIYAIVASNPAEGVLSGIGFFFFFAWMTRARREKCRQGQHEA